jgi:hypothetical protein
VAVAVEVGGEVVAVAEVATEEVAEAVDMEEVAEADGDTESAIRLPAMPAPRAATRHALVIHCG